MELSRRSVLAGIATVPLVAVLPEIEPELVTVKETWRYLADGRWVQCFASGATVLETQFFDHAPFVTWGTEKINYAVFTRFMPAETFRRLFGNA